MAPSFQIGSGWNLAGMFFDWLESDFRFDVTLSRWRPWRHFTEKSAATWRVNENRLSGAYVSTCTSSRSIVHSYLFYWLIIGQANWGDQYFVEEIMRVRAEKASKYV